jgi:hypothetical protein
MIAAAKVGTLAQSLIITQAASSIKRSIESAAGAEAIVHGNSTT